MMKILPFKIDPQVRTYLNHAYAFGMVEGVLGSDIIPRLSCETYINCIYSRDDANKFYIYTYNDDGWFEKTGIVSRDVHVCDDPNFKCVSEALQIAIRRIIGGEYVLCRPNEGRLSIHNMGKPYDFDHECLLWGVDVEEKTFQSSGYVRGKYMQYEIDFDELTNALINVCGGYVDMIFYRVDADFVFGPPNRQNVVFLLGEYLMSKCSELSERTDIKEYIDAGKLKFGMGAWDEFANYIEEVQNTDMRYVRSFLDHNSVFYSLMARERRMSGENMKILVPFQAAEIIKNYGVYLYLGWCTFVRKITIGEFTQYFQAVGSLSGSLISIFCFFKSFNENSRYINAYLEFMKIKPNIEGWDNAGIVSDNKYAASLVLKNVSFKYNDDNQCVLNNISFSFEMGKVYSLIGTNGAGKTTLLNLLCRLYDVTDGEILYNGVPIKQYNIDSYRALFSSVFQQTKTFALSIAENVALDKYRVGDHEQRKTIYAIFQRIGMGDFIDSLPDGIDTQMGKTFDENGVILSGGQMQKIAIARALFRDSEILLFDEPSSALDPIAEDEFFNVLRSVSGGKMVFYVSHRLSSAIFADEILFIRDHKIFAHGPHFELLRTCLEYYEYYNAQAKYYQTEEQNHE